MKELTKAQKLTLIYRHTHADYKGIAGLNWGVHAGKRTIMIGLPNGSALIVLEDLTDADIADKLPYALRKEDQRKQAAADKKQSAETC